MINKPRVSDRRPRARTDEAGPSAFLTVGVSMLAGLTQALEIVCFEAGELSRGETATGRERRLALNQRTFTFDPRSPGTRNLGSTRKQPWAQALVGGWMTAV